MTGPLIRNFDMDIGEELMSGTLASSYDREIGND